MDITRIKSMVLGIGTFIIIYVIVEFILGFDPLNYVGGEGALIIFYMIVGILFVLFYSVICFKPSKHDCMYAIDNKINKASIARSNKIGVVIFSTILFLFLDFSPMILYVGNTLYWIYLYLFVGLTDGIYDDILFINNNSIPLSSIRDYSIDEEVISLTYEKRFIFKDYQVRESTTCNKDDIAAILDVVRG